MKIYQSKHKLKSWQLCSCLCSKVLDIISYKGVTNDKGNDNERD
jgi:hypothetical protein